MEKKIVIEGMSCGHCVNHVKNALSELEGVSNVTVSLDTKEAILESSVEIADEKIKFALEDAGYQVININ